MAGSCKYIFHVILLLAFATPLSSQSLLNRVLRESKRKIERKAEDMLIEKASEAIAQKFYKSMSDAFDKMLLEAAQNDSTYQANYGDSVAIKYGSLADNWMERMNEAADLPESYSFSHQLTIETTDGKETNSFQMLVDKTLPVFAIAQQEDDGIRTILVDAERDVTVMYMENDKEKTAQAIPNLIGLGVSIAQSQIDTLMDDYEFSKTGKSKTILGYHAEEYSGSGDEYETVFYTTKELGIDWRDSFGALMQKFNYSSTDQEWQARDGFMLESRSISKQKKKAEESTWKTTEIQTKTITLVNADYECGGLAQ